MTKYHKQVTLNLQERLGIKDPKPVNVHSLKYKLSYETIMYTPSHIEYHVMKKPDINLQPHGIFLSHQID